MTLLGDLLWLGAGTLAGTPIGAAMGSLAERGDSGRGVSLRVARLEARDLTDWNVWRSVRASLGSTRRTTSARTWENDRDTIVVFLLGVVAVVVAYTRNVVPIATAMFWLSILALVVTVSVFLILYLRHVFDGHGQGWLMVGTVVYACLGPIVAYWLVEPPLHGVLGRALDALDGRGEESFLIYVGPLLLQFVGAVLAFALLLSSMALCIASVSAALIALGAWGHTWFLPVVFWSVRFTTSPAAAVVMVLLAIAAPLLASGLMFEWIASAARSVQIEPIPIPTTQPISPTP